MRYHDNKFLFIFLVKSFPPTSNLPNNMNPTKSAALLIGINYKDTPNAALRGCVNDVLNMKTFLQGRLGFLPNSIKVVHDEDPSTKSLCTVNGILEELTELMRRSWREQLEYVWIHYSGHGAQVIDRNSDEKDGKDECIIPSDFQTNGVITDDVLCKIFHGFHPLTKVVAVFDCCHSGTIADLRYRLDQSLVLVDEHPRSICAPKVITLSGCMDTQTSADAYNVSGDQKFSGALTSCLLLSFNESCKQDIFLLVNRIRRNLVAKGFPQYPMLYSSYDVRKDKRLL